MRDDIRHPPPLHDPVHPTSPHLISPHPTPPHSISPHHPTPIPPHPTAPQASGNLFSLTGGGAGPGPKDNGPATSARLLLPSDVVLDFANQRFFIADTNNFAVRSVSLACPLAFVSSPSIGKCILPAGSVAAIILVGILVPILLCVLCCCLLIGMSDKIIAKRQAWATVAAEVEAVRLAALEEEKRDVEVDLPPIGPELPRTLASTWKEQVPVQPH